eukprot:TRINITY_DN135_c0_g1_i4.p1 TRINITY_DN135_c0_g1~~TRINITY_DN135_c0_g1_i4.p1  ORF type:complete len:309 (+),score=45.12 TRINITY_DN135_c0_g1_i4:251-1177(+)
MDKSDKVSSLGSLEVPTSLASVEGSLDTPKRCVSVVEPDAKVKRTRSTSKSPSRQTSSVSRGGSSISRSSSSSRLKRSKSEVAEPIPTADDDFVYANTGPRPNSVDERTLPDGRKVIIRTWKLRDGCHIQLVTDFLTEQDSASALTEMMEWPHWIHGNYKMYGRDCAVQRLAACCSKLAEDQIFKYRLKKPLQQQPDCVSAIQTAVEGFTGKKIAYADLNYYRDGNDHFYQHRDTHVITGDLVVGVSLGEGRKMLFQHSEDPTVQLALHLPAGSLLIQGERSQLLWKHGIPKTKLIDKPRINITFRQA